MIKCKKCGKEVVRNGPSGWMHRVKQTPTHVVVVA